MPATIYGSFTSGNFYTAGITKPESEVYSVDSEGRATLQLTKTFNDATVTLPALNDNVPGYSLMKVSGFQKKRIDGDLWEVSLTAKGIDANNGGTPTGSLTTFELVNAVAEEPIQTHKDFASIVSAAGLAVIERTVSGGVAVGAVFNNASSSESVTDAITGDFLYFARTASNGLAGIQSYLRPQMVYRISYVQSSKPTSISTVGTVVSPTGAPTLPAGANWLFAALNYRQIGRSGDYEITEEYRASGPEGWNPEIYD